jgi:protein tyrosine phosphatase type 4A
LNGLGRPRILLSTGEKLSLLFSRIEALLEESAQLDMSSQRVGLGAPALIEYKNMRFLITDRPNLSNLATYVQQLKRHTVKVLVRVCEPTYDTERLYKEGIAVKDWMFSDGGSPPETIVKDWLNLVHTWFTDEPGCCVAVHCVAGLGRAPVLVAVALIEAGLRYEDAVELIRL